jgi:hypothetical protein
VAVPFLSSTWAIVADQAGDDVGTVVRRQRVVLDWYAHAYAPPPGDRLTAARAQRRVKRERLSKRQARDLPLATPITAGRVHFVRRVAADGTISFLGETWKVSRGLAYQYVWASVITHCQRLELYHRRSARARWRLIRKFNYAMPERVCRLRPEFKR